MEKSLFEVKKMDCPAEEQLIRMQLEGIPAVVALHFDLEARQLTVLHRGEGEAIQQALDALQLDSRLLGTERPSPEETAASAAPRRERQLLWAVLGINLAFFVLESVYGFLSHSMGLVADSLDMLADALVYGLSLAAVGAALARKQALARLSGYLQLTLALLGFAEVIRRFLGGETLPDFRTMIVVSTLALAANGLSLYLLQRARSREIHMQASLIFTSNDVIVNLGVIAAGLLVRWLHSGLPDLLIGLAVFLLVIRGAIRILKLGQ